MLVIGITGGIACGKSTVARMFGRLGGKVIDADQIAHQLLKPKSGTWQRVVDEFGQDILNKNLAINRRRLGKVVFTDPRKRRKLEKIIHPEVIEIIKERIKGAKGRVVVIDAALLIEAKLVSLVDKLVVVTASRKTQIKRLRMNGLTEAEAISRIDSQMPLKDKASLADYVITNDGSLKETRKQVGEVWKQINKYKGTKGDCPRFTER